MGKLGKSTIQKGFEHLQELSSLIRHPSLAQNKYQTSQREALEDFTNQYYSTSTSEVLSSTFELPHADGQI